MFHDRGGCSCSLSKNRGKKPQKTPQPKKTPTYTALEHLSCEQWSEEPVSVKSLEIVIHIIPQNLQRGEKRSLGVSKAVVPTTGSSTE